MSQPKMIHPSIVQLEKHIKESKRLLHKVEERINHLQEENERLRSEAYKDKELSKLQQKYDELYQSTRRSFMISKDEEEAIDAWVEQHLSEHHPEYFSTINYFGAIGGGFTYTFLPTSIGIIGSISCNQCKDTDKKDHEFIFQNI